MKRSCNAQIQSDGGIIRAVIVVILFALVIVVGLAVLFYETKWPPRVDDRELARIGAPTTAARSIHGPSTVSGSVLCIDSCLVRGRWYSLSQGALEAITPEVGHHLEQKGYRLQSGSGCVQYGPPLLRGSMYQLVCSVIGRKGKFRATAEMYLHTPAPIISPPVYSGEYRLPSPPPSGTSFANGDEILVEVGY